MKKTIFLFSMVILTSLGIAQNNETESNLTLIPCGSTEIKIDSTSQIRKVSFQSFLISNEITNKEFRAFLNYAKLHPEEKLEWVDLDSISGYNFETKKYDGSLKGKKVNIKYCLYKEILDNEIDTLALANEYMLNSDNYKKFQNYISEKTFDDYPVVGISYNGAKYYCMWRTNMENIRLVSEGKQFNMSYRLPTEEEWHYARNYSSDRLSKSEISDSSIIRKIDNREVLNFNASISQWISIRPKSEIYFTLGSSWKNPVNKNEKTVVNKNTKSGEIGFRVVRDLNP